MEKSLKVVEPEKVPLLLGSKGVVFIASSAYDKIKNQLINMQITEDNIFLFNFAFMDLEYTDYEFIYDRIEDFQRAFNKLKDIKSKEIFLDILNYKISKNEYYLEKMQPFVDDESMQYFDDSLYDFLETEIFVDIGAYNGDTYNSFNEKYNGKWRIYYGCEADKEMFAEMLDNISHDKRVNLYNIAAWDDIAELSFSSNIGSSAVVSDGEEKVYANKLDNIISQDTEVSFIKMDIEGAEYNAIIGMKEIIKRNKPIIAVCVYHKRDDFYKLTDLIESIIPDEYCYYYRQYRYTPTETVCYCIPQHRVKSGYAQTC